MLLTVQKKPKTKVRMNFNRDKHVVVGFGAQGSNPGGGMVRYDVRASGVMPSKAPIHSLYVHIMKNVLMQMDGITYTEAAEAMLTVLNELHYEVSGHSTDEELIKRTARVLEITARRMHKDPRTKDLTVSQGGEPIKKGLQNIDDRSLEEKYHFVKEDLDGEGLRELDKYLEEFRYES